MAKDRRDAKLVKQRDDLTGLFPFILKRRTDSVVYYSTMVDVKKILPFVENKKACGVDINFFKLTLLALTRTLFERPHLNRYILGRRLYQREKVHISFISKKSLDEKSDENTVALKFSPNDSHDYIVSKITGGIKFAKGKSNSDSDKLYSTLLKLPRFALVAIVRFLELMDYNGKLFKDIESVDPLRCSAFIANLGSVGIDAPYHHLFEWGTCSIFMAIGKIENKVVCLEDETVGVKKMVEIKFTIDERIADGYYMARSLDIFKNYMENPETLF